MKRSIFLCLIIALIIGSCAQEKKSPIEGAWRLVYGNYTTPDTVMNYPLSSNNMKIIDDKYFSTIWQDTVMDKSNWWSAGFNGGTYTFVNGVYTENLMYFSIPSNIGGKASFNAEIRNDTLVLTYVFETAKKGYSNVEKWKRLE